MRRSFEVAEIVGAWGLPFWALGLKKPEKERLAWTILSVGLRIPAWKTEPWVLLTSLRLQVFWLPDQRQRRVFRRPRYHPLPHGTYSRDLRLGF